MDVVCRVEHAWHVHKHSPSLGYALLLSAEVIRKCSCLPRHKDMVCRGEAMAVAIGR